MTVHDSPVLESVVAAADTNALNNATDKQTAFLDRLLDDLDRHSSAQAGLARHAAVALAHNGLLTRDTCSELISTVLDQVRAAEEANRVEIPNGIHLVDGQYFRVQLNKAGTAQYALGLDVVDGKIVKEYAGRGPLRDLSDATLATVEQAAEFGHEFGICLNCGATLTDPESIARGMGPICASRF